MLKKLIITAAAIVGGTTFAGGVDVSELGKIPNHDNVATCSVEQLIPGVSVPSSAVFFDCKISEVEDNLGDFI